MSDGLDGTSQSDDSIHSCFEHEDAHENSSCHSSGSVHVKPYSGSNHTKTKPSVRRFSFSHSEDGNISCGESSDINDHGYNFNDETSTKVK